MSMSKTIIETETRVNPMTHPALNAVLKAYPIELLAVMVVLQLAKVAILIPNPPQNIEVAAPIMKATVV